MMRSLFLAFAAVVFSCGVASAHAPAQIDIVYDAAGKVVAAVVTHTVEDPAQHYIGKIDIWLNGEEIITQGIGVQDNARTLTVTYRVPDAKSGDTIAVEAYCNMGGQLKKEIQVQ